MMELYVQEIGPVNAPSIIFIHGAVVAGWMWHWQVEELSQDYHCLVPDLPGHGQSPDVKTFSLENATIQIAELIRSRAHEGKAHLVGHSLGGALTLKLMETYPELIDHAIITGPSGGPLPGFMLNITRLFLPLMRREFMLRQNARYLHIPNNIYSAFKESQLRFTSRTYTDVMAEVDRFRISSRLNEIQQPLLAVVGEKEPKTMFLQAHKAVSTLPNAVGRIAPKGSHGWNSIDPDLFNRMVRAWINNQPLPLELLSLN